MDPMASATDGRMTDLRLGPRPCDSRLKPVAGTHLSVTANTSTRSGPATKVGSDSMPNVDVVATLSKARLGRRAATSAMGMATRRARTCETTTSSRSMGTATPSALVTVCLVRNDAPRLPWKMFEIHVPYWATRPLLSPNWCRSTARDDGVSLGPRMARVGSPGRRWTRRKAKTEMRKQMTTSWTRRLAANRSMGERDAQALRHMGVGLKTPPPNPSACDPSGRMRLLKFVTALLAVRDHVASEAHRYGRSWER